MIQHKKKKKKTLLIHVWITILDAECTFGERYSFVCVCFSVQHPPQTDLQGEVVTICCFSQNGAWKRVSTE